MLFVLDRDMQVVAVLDNDTTESLHYYDDEHRILLESGSESYSFAVEKEHPDSRQIVEGNYLVLQNKIGELVRFTIVQVEEHHGEKLVYSESASLDLLNEIVDPLEDTGPHDIWHYLYQATADSGYELGVNEVPHYERTLSFEGFDTALGRILSIGKAFDVEIGFSVEIKQNRVTRQFIDVYKKRGKHLENRLEYGDEVADIRRKVDIMGLVTAYKGIGAEVQQENPPEGQEPLRWNVDFRDIEYDDGEFFSPKGDAKVYNRFANQRWSRYRNRLADTEGYIVGKFQYNTESPEELFNRTVSALQKDSVPAIEYEVILSRLPEGIWIGDTVTVVDHDYNPALYLEARVLDLIVSYTDPSRGTATFGNYRILKSNISEQLRDLQQRLEDARKQWVREVANIRGNLTQTNDRVDEAMRQVEVVQTAANGKNKIFRGELEPTEGMSANDLWYKPVGQGETELYRYDGTVWKLEKVSAGLLAGQLDADVENGDIDLINVNVSTLVGNISEFIKSYWNSINSQIAIDGNSLTITDTATQEKTILQNGRIGFQIGASHHTWGAMPEGLVLRPGGGNTGDSNNAGLWLQSTYYNYIDWGYGGDGGFGVRAAKRDNFFEILSKDGGNFRFVHGADPSTARQWNMLNGLYGVFSYGKTRLEMNGYDDADFPHVTARNNNNGDFAYFVGSAFNVSSERELKENLASIDNALGILARVNYYSYTKSGQRQLGVITDEAPLQILDAEQKTVDLYSYATLIGKGQQEQSVISSQQEAKMELMAQDIIKIKEVLAL